MIDHDEPYIDPEELRAANARHQSDMDRLGIDIRMPGRMSTGWKPQSMIRRGMLTDRKIGQYEKKGFYTAEFQNARRQHWAKQQGKRIGGFLQRDGRMIYSP